MSKHQASLSHSTLPLEGERGGGLSLEGERRRGISLERRLRLGLLLFFLLSILPAQAQVLNLAGSWDLALGDSAVYTDYVVLPGSLLTNGKGDELSIHTQWTGSLYDSSFYFNPFMKRYQETGRMKFPFFLTPSRHYVGTAWYRRSIYVPADWKGQRVILFLERPHIETTVYVNGEEMGHQLSLSAPHEFDVTDAIQPGMRNELVIKVYNGIENVGVGQDSHSVTDQTQGNWNGIAGRMELQTCPRKLSIRNVQVYPDIHRRQAKVVVRLESGSEGKRFIARYGTYLYAEAVCEAGDNIYVSESDFEEAARSTVTLTINLGEYMQTWDEFHPNLYTLRVYALAEDALDEFSGSAAIDTYETQFGMREIRADGTQLFMNDRPIFLRGTVENCCFPLTGYPPTDVEPWLELFGQCKEYGLNHMRFHSYCPPEAAFVAADQLGIMLQPEGPSWPNHGVKLGNGQIIDTYLMDETRRMVEAYGNHPSFCMMAAGNEPAGNWVAWCADWCAYWRKNDPRRIYAGASVGGGWQWDEGSDYHVKGGARGLDWSRHAPQTTDTYTADITTPRNFRPTAEHPTNTEPYISHEQGQWCAFPDLDETRQYTGAYQAGNLDIFRDLLEANGMAGQARKFMYASGKLQALCYRMEMERNLRTPNYAGFQLLSLNDYSGQGTAEVGVLNVFWREKGYVTSQEWRESCAPIVLLAHFPKFVFTPADTLRLPITLYNAYIGTIRPTDLAWFVVDDDGKVIDGKLRTKDMPIGKENPVGTITLPLAGMKAPAKYSLTMALGNSLVKHYEFWIYPDPALDFASASNPAVVPDASASVFEAPTLTDEALAVLKKGGTVLLTAAGRVTLGSDVRQDYTPVFWNTSWFKMKPPHTTGCYIDKDHPLFRRFPTDDWANLNWWELLNRAQVMNLMELPRDYQPPIQPIDTWHVSRKLGMLIEARVLKGRLLMTTMDITSNLERRPVAAQMRRALLAYVQSPDFKPAITLDPQVIRNFFEKQAPPVNMFTNDSPDELKPVIPLNP